MGGGIGDHRGIGWSSLFRSLSDRQAHRREYPPVLVAAQNRMAVASCVFRGWAHIWQITSAAEAFTLVTSGCVIGAFQDVVEGVQDLPDSLLADCRGDLPDITRSPARRAHIDVMERNRMTRDAAPLPMVRRRADRHAALPTALPLVSIDELDKSLFVAARRTIPIATAGINAVHALSALLIFDDDPRHDRVVRERVAVLVCGVVARRGNHLDDLVAVPHLHLLTSSNSSTAATPRGPTRPASTEREEERWWALVALPIVTPLLPAVQHPADPHGHACRPHRYSAATSAPHVLRIAPSDDLGLELDRVVI